MSTYAIGDLQGCLGAFERLLEQINFKAGEDRLLLAGDLVARGPDSVGTLRKVYALRDHVRCVLGNHDLHLLAVAHGAASLKKKDHDLQAILDAPDGDELLSWLRQQPLMIDIPEFDAVMTHAGIPPLWTLDQARSRAREVEAVLHGDHCNELFNNMYGNEPAGWSDDLHGADRLRVITNHFTRMRFINQAGELELQTKGEADAPPPGYFPWFDHPQRIHGSTRILFGHWAALAGDVAIDGVEALDSGCVWDGFLTAFRLEDQQRFQCDCRKHK
ncbi:MAG: symmetrical bis(5'-nucleosyl)-tetraphosphatase [Alcanivoracaceae bacterium]|nr:symmetrical bis(5'-nucleosyl)-tetraphosphatase [Alcanivoracaceae bacterium]